MSDLQTVITKLGIAARGLEQEIGDRRDVLPNIQAGTTMKEEAVAEVNTMVDALEHMTQAMRKLAKVQL